MNNDLHFSSAKSDWETPDDFFQYWNQIFNFQLDVCAHPWNAKCAPWLTEQDNGLACNWQFSDPKQAARRCWMNPPYSRGKNGIIAWVKKAYEESLNGCLVVCLLPARPDTRWWHDYCTKGTVKFIKGRLKFKGATSAAPFPSAIVIFWPAGMAMI